MSEVVGNPITVGSLFSGIGGLDLGLERSGFSVRWQVEIEDWNRRVLAKHWPDARRFEDVREFPGDATDLRVDVIAGGFPCQDLSTAGKRRGLAGERSGLWREFARIVGVLRPRYVLVENVPGIRSPIKEKGAYVEPAPLGRVLGDLAALGFDAEEGSVPASLLGANYRRDRVFVLAYPSRNGSGLGGVSAGPRREGQGAADAQGAGEGPNSDPDRQSRAVRESLGRDACEEQKAAERDRRANREPATDAVSDGISGGPRAEEDAGQETARASGESGRPHSPFVGSGWWGTEPDVVRMVYGVPRRLVRPAIAGLGNAVVPQVAEYIGRRLMSIIEGDACERSASQW